MESKSVWVCWYKESLVVRERCMFFVNGKCLSQSANSVTEDKPCDAVEYAPVVKPQIIKPTTEEIEDGKRKHTTFTIIGGPRFICLVGDDDEERLNRRLALMEDKG